jgi:iron complex outermembrane recepter protein
MAIPVWFARLSRVICFATLIASVGLKAEAQGRAVLAEPPAVGEQTAPDEPFSPTSPQSEKQPTEQSPVSELEQLLQRPVQVPALAQVVNTVSRQESTVGKSPAAVFVITNDMIRRSGATSIPETLRMAPGVYVARIDANKWAISTRGFNNRFASNLLVQVDGRVVYNPIFNGVYWDTVDYVLQDIERIEVIRGPGATVWGSNAVNGIINIITKNSKDTQGLLVSAAGGSEDKGIASVRYGGVNDDDSLRYRVYGKWFERDRAFLPGGGFQLPTPTNGTPFNQAKDDWRAGRSGFRVDWDATESDIVQLQGDIFQVNSARGDFRPLTMAPFVVQNDEDEVSTGGNLLARWQHQMGDDSNWALQFYWDHFGRVSTKNFFKIRADTLDLDFQQQFPLSDRQKFIYGMGYRAVDTFFGGDGFAIGTNLTPIDSATPIPVDRTLSRYAAFLQEEFTLVEDQIYFTAGSKFEHNTLAGFQYQPTGRLLWTPTERQSAWGAVSRAVRIPSIRDDAIVSTGVTFPPLLPGQFNQSRGSPNLNAEDLMAYELGYRAQPTDAFSFDTALFYNVYNNLMVTRPAPAGVAGPAGTLIFPANNVNGMNAESYGVELATNYRLSETWRLQGHYSWLQMLVHSDPGIPHGVEQSIEGSSPQNQVYLQSSWDLTKTVEFDLMGRYVEQLWGFPSAVPNTVPSYISMDARLGWRPNDAWELALVGQNLLDSHHLEFGGNQFLSAPLIELQRGVYGMVTWRH